MAHSVPVRPFDWSGCLYIRRYADETREFRNSSAISVAAAAILVSIYPLFAWLAASPTLTTLSSSQGIIAVLMAGYMGGLGALMAELFPTQMRTTGLSISYAFGVAIFGGFAPFINTWLIEVTNMLAPSYYLMFAAVISLLALRAAPSLGLK